MAQLRDLSAAKPPGGAAPADRRPPRWYRKPFTALRRAWQSQSDLWERWYAAPYKDHGQLRWQRREGTWVLDGAEVPKPRKGDK